MGAVSAALYAQYPSWIHPVFVLVVSARWRGQRLSDRLAQWRSGTLRGAQLLWAAAEGRLSVTDTTGCCVLYDKPSCWADSRRLQWRVGPVALRTWVFAINTAIGWLRT